MDIAEAFRQDLNCFQQIHMIFVFPKLRRIENIFIGNFYVRFFCFLYMFRRYKRQTDNMRSSFFCFDIRFLELSFTYFGVYQYAGCVFRQTLHMKLTAFEGIFDFREIRFISVHQVMHRTHQFYRIIRQIHSLLRRKQDIYLFCPDCFSK